MRDTAGDPPDRLHLRRLPQAILQAGPFGFRELSFGDVAQVDDQGTHGRILEQVRGGDLQPAVRAIAVSYQELALDDVAGPAQALLAQREGHRTLVRMDELEELPAAHLVHRVAGETFERRARVDNARRLGPRDDDGIGAVLDHRAEAPFVRLQRALAP